jgi:hypothetical protein
VVILAAALAVAGLVSRSAHPEAPPTSSIASITR